MCSAQSVPGRLLLLHLSNGALIGLVFAAWISVLCLPEVGVLLLACFSLLPCGKREDFSLPLLGLFSQGHLSLVNSNHALGAWFCASSGPAALPGAGGWLDHRNA